MIDDLSSRISIPGRICRAAILLLAAIGPVGMGSVFASEKPDSFQHPADSLKLEQILFPKSLTAELSPDGTTVLLTVSEFDLEADRIEFSAWKVAFSGGEPIQLTRGEPDDRSFTWRPDGKGICFLGKRGDTSGLYFIDVDGGEPRPVFSPADGIGSYAWSPDGRKIAWTSRKKQDDSAGEIMDRNRDILCLRILDVESKGETVLVDGESLSVLEMSWSPDSRGLVFAALPVTDGYISLENSIQSDLYYSAPVFSSDEKAESSRPRPRRLTDNAGEDRWPGFSPDGLSVVYMSRPPGDLVGGYRASMISVDGGNPGDVTPLDGGHHSRYVFAGNNETVYFFGYRGVECRIFRMPLHTRSAEALALPSGVNSSLSFSLNGARMVFTHSDPGRPVEVYSYEPGSNSVRRLTSMNGAGDHSERSRTETLRWRSRDGNQIEGLLVYPFDYDPEKAYPLLVELHGGPAGLYARDFDPKSLYFASLGYFYFKPNYRGSAGYGRDFRTKNIGDWGGGDLADVLSGIDRLLERPGIDPDRIGVMGWSYGGYLTAWAVTRTGRFKAAAVGAGFVDNVVMWAANDGPLHFSAYFGGTPLGDGLIDLYRGRSPAAFAHRVRTPVLIQHGKLDTRVPTFQGVLWYRLLHDAGVPALLILYPGMGHSPMIKPSLWLDVIERQVEWFDEYLKPNPGDPKGGK
jgi:dipeptidyl aminopeptidase/acylaminoacyl peptidase